MIRQFLSYDITFDDNMKTCNIYNILHLLHYPYINVLNRLNTCVKIVKYQ